MQNIAQPWLALQVTNNPALVGTVVAAEFLPVLLFTLFSGAIIDKMNKKTIMLITQSALAFVSLMFALSIVFDFVTFPLIIALALMMGLVNSLDMPCRQSIIYELMDDKNAIPSAIALNSMTMSVCRVLGPSIAGIVMAKFGVAACFFANAISYAAIILSLFFVKIASPDKKSTEKSVIKAVKAGFSYIKNHEILLSPLVITLIIGTLIPNYSTTVSALVKYNLNSGEEYFGYLMACLGFGGFFGALYIALTSSRIRYKVVSIASTAAASSLILIGFMQTFFTVALFLVITSFFFVIANSTINSLLQINSDPTFRGRVMSVHTLFFMGSTPIGATFAGWICKDYGADKSFIVCGILVYILMAAWQIWVKKSHKKS